MFLSLFSLDVFGAGYGFFKTLLALLIHLIPVYLVVIVLFIAWRREWVGAALFAILSLLYPVLTRGREHWTAYVTISGSLALIAVLFLLNWIYRAQLRTR
jgi:hypothetical protein